MFLELDHVNLLYAFEVSSSPSLSFHIWTFISVFSLLNIFSIIPYVLYNACFELIFVLGLLTLLTWTPGPSIHTWILPWESLNPTILTSSRRSSKKVSSKSPGIDISINFLPWVRKLAKMVLGLSQAWD